MNTASTVTLNEPRTGAASSLEPRFERILVGIDFSDSSKAAFDYACSLAHQFHSQLYLLHAVEPCIYPEDLASGISVEEIDGRWTAQKKAELEKFKAVAENQAGGATIELKKGLPWKQIVETAQSWKADLIILGTRGLTGLKHVVMGSTAEKVVRHAACPVLVMHAPCK